MRVLIALDATPHSVAVVRQAAARPWPPGSAFLLLHVLDPFPFAKAPVALQRARAAALKVIREAGDGLIRAGWQVETEVVLGLARKTVPICAKNWHADLVLVGSHGAGPFLRLFLGSTARSVLRAAPCSVEVVRTNGPAEAAAAMKVLLATDGSPCSLAAVRAVAARPWPPGCQFKVIAIPEPFLPLGDFPYFEVKEIEDLNNAALEEAQRHAADAAAMLQHAGLLATTKTPLPRDTGARDIVGEAEACNADLIVLGSHGRRGFERLALGSFSEHVAVHAPCCVEVIRAPEARGNSQTEGEQA